MNGLIKDDRFGFEEIAYLLILGELPDKKQLEEFKTLLAEMRKLPRNFTKDVILKAPSKDMMMSLQRSVLTLASYDKKFDDIGVNNVIRQCLWLVSVFPMLAVYGYHAYNHFINDDSLYIHHPDPDLSTAENFLRMLRPDKSFTPLEASVLDLALILHMEHGGGNNSTFTTRVVTSSGTDTYSAISAALASLKGPKHGGANIKVVQMMRNIRENVHDLKDEDEIYAYLLKILRKETFDHKGLIYGMGTRSIRCPTRARRCSRSSSRGCLNRRASRGSTTFTSASSGLRPRRSRPRGRSTRASAPTSTFTADLSTTCWAFRWSFTPRCSRWRA